MFEALFRASQEAIKEGLRGPNLGWIAYGVGESSGKSSDSILPSQRDLQVLAATSLAPGSVLVNAARHGCAELAYGVRVGCWLTTSMISKSLPSCRQRSVICLATFLQR